jgi:hypothetical protein
MACRPLRDPSLRLAILSLVQVATLPSFMVRPPERLVLTRPAPVLARHLSPPSANRDGENRSWSLPAEQVCEKWTDTHPAHDVMRCLSPFPDGRQFFPCSEY